MQINRPIARAFGRYFYFISNSVHNFSSVLFLSPYMQPTFDVIFHISVFFDDFYGVINNIVEETFKTKRQAVC